MFECNLNLQVHLKHMTYQRQIRVSYEQLPAVQLWLSVSAMTIQVLTQRSITILQCS